ncbi:MAG: ABC transporter permease [Rubrobacter sp.]|nr:ABC transporter permease [Rubrobacter sp.]
MSFLDYLGSRWDELIELSIAHAIIVAISLAIATVLGVLVGAIVYSRRRAASAVLNVTSTFLTIPSFALFGIMISIPFLGLGATSAIVALVLYALLPIVRNTVTGLQGVDPAVSESAAGMGLSARQRLLRVEMPLAWPVILAGIRVSMLLIMGIAAIAAYINVPGLGEPIFDGLGDIGTSRGPVQAWGGTLGIVVLALIFDAFLALLGKLTTSGGLK